MCAVCLEDGAIATLVGCTHVFHDACAVQCAHAEVDRLHRQYLEALTCPLCRSPSTHYRVGSDMYAFKRATHAPTMYAELRALSDTVERAVRDVLANSEDQVAAREARRMDRYFKVICNWLIESCDKVLASPPFPVD
jgi:hypothetical protein